MHLSNGSRHLLTGLYLQIWLLLLSCSLTFAQSDLIVAQGALAEKVYLQMDADLYTTDQTIWFKAVVLESASHRPSGLSGVLHVELISPNEQLLAQKRVRLNHGIGQGSIELSDKMPRGRYLLRAYTNWNRNFDSDFIFRKYIDIFPAAESRTDDPILGTTVEEKEPGSYWLRARIFPRIIDRSHSRHLSVYLTMGDATDSILLRENRQGFYELNHPLSPGATMATVRIETQNGSHYSKTVAMQQAPVDLQFFPEGGGWLTGVPTKVAFKALDYLGQGIPVSGRIVDVQGHTLDTFRSNHLGMGSIELLAKTGQSYHAVLDSMPNTHIADKYPLPQPQSEGYALHIRQQDENIAITAHDRTGTTDSLYVRISNRGLFRYMIRALPKNGQLQAILPKGSLPEGIVRFTLLDHLDRPLAERLYFNRRPGARLGLAISADKERYAKRERTDVGICVHGIDGRPAVASVSLMAVHVDHIGNRRALRENILTHLLLQSELRGEIADPGHYFGEGSGDREKDLDDLLLSQGWRHYKYDSPPHMDLPYTNEVSLTLSGEVIGGVISRKKREGAAISLLTFGEGSDMQVQQTDSLGRFRFPLELYTDSADVLLQSADAAGRNRNYSFSIDSAPVPRVDPGQGQSAAPPDSTVAYLIRKREERIRTEQAYLDAIEIEEVIVERRVRTPQEQKVFERFGPADTTLSGKAIQEKERDWHWGVYSVLRSDFLDVVRVVGERIPHDDGSSHLRLRASLGPVKPERDLEGITLVVVDGIPVQLDSYDLIQSIPPGEVKSIEFIKFAKDIYQLYSEVHPMASPDKIPRTGHVVAIYTHAGRGLYQALRSPPGILQVRIPVYSPIVEFYAPRYGTPEERGTDRPDLRTLLHWAPQIVTDPEGRASLHYYNADTPGEVAIIVEAVTPEGEIGYHELVYTVEDGSEH